MHMCCETGGAARHAIAWTSGSEPGIGRHGEGTVAAEWLDHVAALRARITQLGEGGAGGWRCRACAAHVDRRMQELVGRSAHPRTCRRDDTRVS
eukprot:scaffold9000_cov139-Isochrysis_galbana.AAC.4